MPSMIIRVTNATFESVTTGDYASVDDAYRAAVLSGLEIATEEMSGGSDSVIVNVAVDVVGEREVVFGAVAVSTARIFNGRST